jgi:hypothetical protein
MADFDDRSGRDSRLLALVILIAVVVLVVLARFRFPQARIGTRRGDAEPTRTPRGARDLMAILRRRCTRRFNASSRPSSR